MPKLKLLSGKEIIKIFSKFGFEIVSQRGSHLKLRRVLKDGTKQTLTIPIHDELDKGKHGLWAFEKEEYVAAIHILVFQIEGILRDLLGKLGLPTFSYRRNKMREGVLSGILVSLSQIEEMDKDFLKFIEIISL